MGESRRLVVVGDPRAPSLAAACARVLEAAGLEPGLLIDGEGRRAPTRRKIVGGSASPPPLVIGGGPPADLGDAASHAVLLARDSSRETWSLDRLEALVLAVPETGLVACDATIPSLCAIARRARARVAFFGLDVDETSDVTPTWLGVVVPPAETARPFDLFAGGSYCGRATLGDPALGSIRDAIGVIATCAEAFGVGVELAKRVLARAPEAR